MRFRAALLICAVIFSSGCAQPYRATSPQPVLVQVSDLYFLNQHGAKVPVAALVAVDGQTIATPTPTGRDFREIDPGAHRLTVTSQGTVLSLNANLQGGHRYRIICAQVVGAQMKFSVQAHVRDLGTSKIVSNIAEQSLPPLANPVAPRR